MCDILKQCLQGPTFLCNTVQKFGVSMIFYNLIIDTFIQQGCIISDKKTFIILQKIFYFK